MNTASTMGGQKVLVLYEEGIL